MENNYLKVEDNYLEDKDLFIIKDLNFQTEFPLYKNHVSKSFYKGDYLFHLEHFFYLNDNICSDYIYILESLLFKIKPKKINLLKLQQNFKNSKKVYTSPSAFNYQNSQNCIFFCNSSNLEINLIGGPKIESKQNRVIFFKNTLAFKLSPQTDVPTSTFLLLNYSE
jgi:hypothetical protein